MAVRLQAALNLEQTSRKSAPKHAGYAAHSYSASMEYQAVLKVTKRCQ